MKFLWGDPSEISHKLHSERERAGGQGTFSAKAKVLIKLKIIV